MFVFVLLYLVFQYLAKRSAGKNVSEMTYFVSGGMWNLNQSIIQYFSAVVPVTGM